MNKNTHPPLIKNKQRGFSLIEIMIAVLILAAGILAVSKLQTSLVRSGSDANNRSIASSIAQRKVDDLRRFIHVSSSTPGITWDNIATNSISSLKHPASLAFEHIADNKGGRIKPNSTTIGNQTYTLSWTIADYHFDGEDTAATVTTPALSTLKIAHIKVIWDGVGDTTNNIVSFDTALYGYDSKNTALAGNSGSKELGEINLLSQAVYEYGIGVNLNRGSNQVAPDVSKKGNSVSVDTVTDIYDDLGVLVSRDSFKNRKCTCQTSGTETDSSHAIWGSTWNVANSERRDYILPISESNHTVETILVDNGGGDAQDYLCGICCRDGLDGLSSTEKVCRIKETGGAAHVYERPWKLIAFNIIPNSYLTDGVLVESATTSVANTNLNKATYINYVHTLVRNILLKYTTTTAFNALTTVDSSFASYNSNYNDGTVNHVELISDTSRALRAEVVYLDFPPNGIYEGTTYTATNVPIERIYIDQQELSSVVGWATDEDNINFVNTYTMQHDTALSGTTVREACNASNINHIVCTSNQELLDKSEGDYERGVFHPGAISSPTIVNVKASIFTGNNGLIDREINTETITISSIDLTIN